jgi:hypothetical protein
MNIVYQLILKIVFILFAVVTIQITDEDNVNSAEAYGLAINEVFY